MSHPSSADFSAGDSLLGYLYQCEYALYHLLDRDNLTTQLSIEALDDIVVGSPTNPQALLQLKLHNVNGDGVIRSLTDRNPDLWKTLRVWATHIVKGRVDPTKTTFFLLTTAPLGTQEGIGHLLVPEESVILGSDGSMCRRNVAQAITTLRKLASDILSDDTLDRKGSLIKGASAFSGLRPAQQLDLVRNIIIVTGTPPILELRKKIENRLRACGSTKETHKKFVETIIGWWYLQCVEQIADKDGRTITFEALELKMAETAKSLALPNLPRYESLERPQEAELANLAGRLFVRQLQALGLSAENTMLKTALLDYYKADGHRKKWLEELRIDQLELDAFQSELRSIWSTNFGLAEPEIDDCTSSSDPKTALERLGRHILSQTLHARSPRLKGFEGEYLGRGSYHIMANRWMLGWHPHWEKLFPKDDPS